MKEPKYGDKYSESSFQTIILTYLGLVLISFLAVYYRGHILGRDFPYDTYLPKPPPFGDFLGPLTEWRAGDLTTSGLGQNYFPSTYLVLDIISNLAKQNDLLAIALALVPSTVIISSVFVLILRDWSWQYKALLVVFVISSYPVLFSLHTGNLEIWVTALICISVLAFERRAFRIFGIAIGIAASFKAFPIVFLIIPLVHPATNSKLKNLLKIYLFSFLGLVIPTITSVVLLKGGLKDNGLIAFQLIVDAISKSLEMHKDLMWDTIAGSHFGHSILNSVHVIFGMEVLAMDQFIIPILALGVFATSQIGYVAYKSRQVSWLLWTIPATLACLYVPTSTDYKLMYFLPALALMLKATTNKSTFKQKNKFETFAGLALVTLFAAKPWGYIGSEPFANGTTYLTTIAMVVLSVLAYLHFRRAPLVFEPRR